MLTLTLALGHLTLPVCIQESVGTLSAPFEQTTWTFGNIISIKCFVLKPPSYQSTVAKHVLKVAPLADAAEQDLAAMLVSSLSSDPQEQRFGIGQLDEENTAILSTSSGANQFVLHIVKTEHSHPSAQLSYHQGVIDYPLLAPDALMAQPLRIMRLCEQWPDSTSDLKALAAETHAIASLYGYKDMWSVLKGICERFQIDVDQLVVA